MLSNTELSNKIKYFNNFDHLFLKFSSTSGLETDKNEAGKPDLVELDETDEYVTTSNYPLEDDSGEDKELPKVKPVKTINRFVIIICKHHIYVPYSSDRNSYSLME
jgi:hypothetical protein